MIGPTEGCQCETCRRMRERDEGLRRAAMDGLEEERRRRAATRGPTAPVDRSARTTLHGTPEPEHLAIDPATGMQKDYVVLTAEERAKGWVRPYLSTYRHTKCGTTTTMGRALSETYARDPEFYSGTYCCACKGHFPVGEEGEFVWDDGSGRKVGT